MSAREILFAYGTLRSDARHPMHATLAGGADPVGAGFVRGRLLVVDWYPGLVDTESARGRVRGELWAVHDPRLWTALDAYEGDEYVRMELAAELDSGLTQKVWAYVYVADPTGLRELRSGDWLTR